MGALLALLMPLLGEPLRPLLQLGFAASFAATEARHRAGLASLVELEDARRSQLAAQTAVVTLQRELHTAWISLYRAAGGGWQREAQTAAARP